MGGWWCLGPSARGQEQGGGVPAFPVFLASLSPSPPPHRPILRPWLSVCECSLGGWECSGLHVHAQWTAQAQDAGLCASCGPRLGSVCSGPPGLPACQRVGQVPSFSGLAPMLKIGKAGLALMSCPVCGSPPGVGGAGMCQADGRVRDLEPETLAVGGPGQEGQGSTSSGPSEAFGCSLHC